MAVFKHDEVWHVVQAHEVYEEAGRTGEFVAVWDGLNTRSMIGQSPKWTYGSSEAIMVVPGRRFHSPDAAIEFGIAFVKRYAEFRKSGRVYSTGDSVAHAIEGWCGTIKASSDAGVEVDRYPGKLLPAAELVILPY